MSAAASAAPPQRQRTPSFVCAVPLRVAPAEERVMLARLEAARQVYNACLGEARKRVRLVRQSKAFQRARTLQRDDPARRTLFAQARSACACSEYGLHAYADQLRQSWLGDHLDSNTCQKLASRAYATANRLLLGQARRVRGVSRHQLDTVEGKTNTSGIRWRGTQVEWSGLVLPALLNKRDLVQAHGLSCPVKYVRLVRRKQGLRNRFSAQLVCEGTPFRKPQHQLGSGIVGLDLGPSALAVASLQAALLEAFCPEVAPDAKALRRLDRQLDRQRRANNPANYDERGRVKRGRKRWKVSRRQRKVQARRRELYRKLAATRKRSHGELAHRVLALGNTFQLEQLSYRAWQKTYGKSVQLCAPGMNARRLSRLAASAGGTIVLINPWRARLSPLVLLWEDQEESPLTALACVPMWHQYPAGSLQRLPGPVRSSRDLPARRRSGQSGLAGVGAHPASGVRAGHVEPTHKRQETSCRLWSASGRPESEWVACRRVAQSDLRALML